MAVAEVLPVKVEEALQAIRAVPVEDWEVPRRIQWAAALIWVEWSPSERIVSSDFGSYVPFYLLNFSLSLLPEPKTAPLMKKLLQIRKGKGGFKR